MIDATDPLKRFWQFFYERQSIWYRRHVLELSPPWTSDPYLSRFRFCNVQRDLDVGTQVIKEDVLDSDLDAYAKVHAVIFYRMVNNRHTWRNLTGVVTSPSEMLAGLEMMRGKSGVWSSAWISTAMSKMATTIVSTDYSKLVKLIEQGDQPTSAVREVVRRYPGLSGMVGFQISLDLSTVTPRKSADVIYAHSSHHNKGRGDNAGGSVPGALIIKPEMDPVETINRLHKSADAALSYLDLDWQTVASPAHSDIHLHDVEHAVCEFTKYERVRTGKTRNPSRPYLPARG